MPQVNIEMDGPVAIVRFTNPPDGFMDGKTVREVTAMSDQLVEDKGDRANIITGGLPDVFIRHYSVVELEARAREQRAAGMSYNLIQPIPERQLHADFRRIEDSPQTIHRRHQRYRHGGRVRNGLAL